MHAVHLMNCVFILCTWCHLLDQGLKLEEELVFLITIQFPSSKGRWLIHRKKRVDGRSRTIYPVLRSFYLIRKLNCSAKAR